MRYAQAQFQLVKCASQRGRRRARSTVEYVARDESGEDKGLFFDGGPLTPQRRRRLKFQMFVARDFLAVFVVMQICVLFLAAVK